MARSKKTSIQEQQEESIDKQAIQLAQRAAFLPEVQCSYADVIRENCFDVYKLLALITVSQEEDAYLGYRKIFGNTRIVIEEIYPNHRTWELYDAALRENGENYTSVISTFIPVTLLNVSVRPEIHSFGYLNVTMYG